MDISKLEKNIEYNFQDKRLLKQALTHRSYINENSSWGISNNERMEFLGDAVLELIVTEELFNRYPEEAEGKLTSLRASLVNYQMLSSIARDNIHLEQFILLSRGEAKDTGRAREVILANAIEALIGSIYLDGHYASAKTFVIKFILPNLDQIIRHGLDKDAKSLLQEKVQARLKITPIYKMLDEKGPEHEKVFRVGVYFGDKFITDGEGLSKQEAELEAAKKALILSFE